MHPRRLMAIALLVIGLILLMVGFNATEAPSEELTEAFTGRYSDQTMMYLVVGAVLAVLGGLMLLRK